MASESASKASRLPACGFGTVTSEDIRLTAARMRALALTPPLAVARTLAKTIDAWRDHSYAPRRAVVSAIAAAWGFSEQVLEASLDALFAPFTADALAAFASASQSSSCTTPVKHDRPIEILGMVMPGNLPGAGLHEVLIGLIRRRSLMLKTSVAEPIFFAAFARSIRQFDRILSGRIAVFNWSRDRDELTNSMQANCDRICAFGDDETLHYLKAVDGSGGQVAIDADAARFGFGERYSGAYVSIDATTSDSGLPLAVSRLAHDITLFEQAGCLSPHHIFVEAKSSADDTHRHTRQFAADLASALHSLSAVLPSPVRLGLETAASLRRARETARWRMLGGEPVGLWESPGLGWTVIYDQRAGFTPSPGYRTVTVSPVKGLQDFAQRMTPVDGRVEAFALAGSDFDLKGVREHLGKIGASYLCAPGMMQSPPLDWRHGGGAFLDAMREPIRPQI
jgi:Acyl-CoA reductase (LuxC)